MINPQALCSIPVLCDKCYIQHTKGGEFVINCEVAANSKLRSKLHLNSEKTPRPVCMAEAWPGVGLTTSQNALAAARIDSALVVTKAPK